MAGRHVVLIHPSLCFSGVTERMLATARALEAQDIRVTVVSTPGTRARMAEELGFQTRFAELPPDPWRAPFATLRTRRMLRSLKPDVIHATDDSVAPLVSTLAPMFSVPWILELHLPAVAPLAPSRGLPGTAIVSSESLIASVVNHGGVPRDRVRVVKNAPEAPAERGLPATGRRPPVIGCSGLLNDSHATEWFLEAARLLVLGGSRASFAVLGEGPNEGRLRRWVRERGLAERVTIAVPTTPDVAASIGALDIHVSCKLEGGPGWLACLAVALGVPSVFVAADDAYDLVEDKSSGVLVEPENPRRLADELQLLCANPGAAERMGRRGRVRFLTVCPPGGYEGEVARTYEALLGAVSA